MEEKFKKALQRAISFLQHNSYRYALIGGLANQYWGRARFTFDVDFKLLVPDTDYSAVREKIRSAFPERSRPHTVENPLIVDVMLEEIAVDFLLAIPGYEENIITRAVPCEFDQIRIQICSPEDLIIQKAVANRSRDWDDIEGILIEQYGKLDTSYVEAWLVQFVEALDRPEMLEGYRSLQQKICKGV